MCVMYGFTWFLHALIGIISDNPKGDWCDFNDPTILALASHGTPIGFSHGKSSPFEQSKIIPLPIHPFNLSVLDST